MDEDDEMSPLGPMIALRPMIGDCDCYCDDCGEENHCQRREAGCNE